MAKQYFLTIQTFLNGLSSHPEKAIAQRIINTLDRCHWNKGIDALETYLQEMEKKVAKEYHAPEFMNRYALSQEKGNTEVIHWHHRGPYAYTAYEVRDARPRYHVQMPEGYLRNKYADFASLPREEQWRRAEVEMGTVSAFLDGSSELASLIVTTFQEQFQGWKIELIDFTHPRFEESEKGKESENG